MTPFETPWEDYTRPYLIAEVGIAPAGDLSRALAYVDAVANTGAVDAVKTQYHRPDLEFQDNRHPFYPAVCKSYLTIEELEKIKDAVERRGMEFLCTAFHPEALQEIDPLVRCHKVGSGESQWERYVGSVENRGKPVLISAGLGSHCVPQRISYLTLVCTSLYPVTPADAGLGDKGRAWKEVPWGYSCHQPGISIALAAIALGALVVEKHVKLSDSDPDAEAAIWVEELQTLRQMGDDVFEAVRSTDADVYEVAKACVRDKRGRRVSP